jgi:hypothetical protein
MNCLNYPAARAVTVLFFCDVVVVDRAISLVSNRMTVFPRQASPPIDAFGTFWTGELDPISYSCLASFPHLGMQLRLYSYDCDMEVPDGVSLRDAREIVDTPGLMDRFIVDGRPSASKFSNYFRYVMIQKTGLCWVDCDVLALRKVDFFSESSLFARQKDGPGFKQLNGAVLRFSPDHPMLIELIDRARAGADVSTGWGVLGPTLITEMAQKHGIFHLARPKEDFYPIRGREFWKPLLTAYRKDTERAIQGATFLHLWHEMYRKSGYQKDVAPVAGSFLHEMFRRLGTLGRFSRVYEGQELRSLLGDYFKPNANGMTKAVATG